MVKVINQRTTGSLYHYAHFMCDAVFPEVVHDLYKHEIVYRRKDLGQTLGNFSKIWEEIFGIKNVELPHEQFDSIPGETVCINGLLKRKYTVDDFHKFRNYIFNRFGIHNDQDRDTDYPEILLIERGDRVNLIDDPDLSKLNTNVKNGRERREIKNIDTLKGMLSQEYAEKYESVILETLSFTEQIKYFNNAQVVIGIHGAGLANLFFCRRDAIVIEIFIPVTEYFDVITTGVGMRHHKCKNDINSIYSELKKVYPS